SRSYSLSLHDALPICTALMQASVPLLTKRILSTFGTIETANFAISVSIFVGIPKDVPRVAFSITLSTTGAKACPRTMGPHEAIRSEEHTSELQSRENL